MRRYLLACAAALIPATGFGQPHCAIPSPSFQASNNPSPVSSPNPSPAAPVAPNIDLSSAPALKHIVQAGAQISDLGISHGMRTVVARNGGQFMIFTVAPDGQALVSGLMADINLQRLLTIGGNGVTELPERHGLRAFFLKNGAHFQVFYATPDNERVIPGVLWDAAGQDITRDQVAAIPGAIPTIAIGPTARVAGNSSSSLALVQTAAYGSAGSKEAPSLWMFVDPQCSYSIRAMQQLEPFVAQGKIRLNVIPISLLDQEDGGLSTKRAQQLLSATPASLVSIWQAGTGSNQMSPDSADKLRLNMAIAQTINLRGTPTFLWRKTDGGEGREDGLPADFATLIANIGGR